MIDPSVTQQTWQDFDDDVSARLRRIWDLPNDPPALQNWQNDYAKLPERLGGLNIRSATIESRPAFISSVVRTQPTRLSLLGEDIKVPGFERALKELEVIVPQEYSNHEQRGNYLIQLGSESGRGLRSELNRISYEACWNSLESEAKDLGETRLQGILLTGLQPYARRALCLVPNTFNRTLLGNETYKMAARYALGSTIWQQRLTSGVQHEPITCQFCNKGMDRYGDHAIGCPRSSLRTRKHDDLRNLNGQQARAAGANVIREQRGLVQNLNDRPADNIFTNLPGIPPDRRLWVDYSVPSPFAEHCFFESCNTLAAATTKCEQKKVGDATEAASLSNADFSPFVVATTGGFGDYALEVTATIARARSSRWGLIYDQVRELMINQIAICVQRGNARMWQAAHKPEARRLAFGNLVSHIAV
jgi:hypothetical protein